MTHLETHSCICWYNRQIGDHIGASVWGGTVWIRTSGCFGSRYCVCVCACACVCVYVCAWACDIYRYIILYWKNARIPEKFSHYLCILTYYSHGAQKNGRHILAMSVCVEHEACLLYRTWVTSLVLHISVIYWRCLCVRTWVMSLI
jgi:hypothetical protein